MSSFVPDRGILADETEELCEESQYQPRQIVSQIPPTAMGGISDLLHAFEIENREPEPLWLRMVNYSGCLRQPVEYGPTSTDRF